MEVFPEFTMQKIGARMMDIIAATEDAEHRAWLAELFPDAGFHGYVHADGTTRIEVRTLTEHGSVTLAVFDGATVGYVVDAYGRAQYLA
jgi:hypothetical protein